MMNYKDFYDIATYLNGINRNTFTEREVAENAHIYYADFEWSKKHIETSHTIKELAKLLAEDGSDECKKWLYDMTKELEFFDMDFMDYMETDKDIVEMFLADEHVEEEKITINGIIFKHGENDYGLWEGFYLTEEEENAIMEILKNHDTEGCSVRGTRKQIAREME